ncbi:MAG: DUF1499 domain-containing protein [Ectothiorhodospiraceae bacterium]|nr:DUF1499 domain-containing protein [Ectothiorhodospiraceae bacterium]MCH8506039.1 DUF1499 domain-containing protein [Ectothiorhodospiraceae bacterium]
MAPVQRAGGIGRFAAITGLILLVAAMALLAGSGPAYRLDLLSLGAAFSTLRYGVFVSAAAGLLGLLALVSATWARHLWPGLLGGALVLGSIALVAIPFMHWQQAQRVPPIHDITTDPSDPPPFEALADAREAAPNAVDYPGEETAQLQLEAYPDIGPRQLDASLEDVRQAAEAQVLAFGWELVAANEHSLEATATTTWFGFQDDVVVRYREYGDGVRVDMRSASRIGRSDVGANAARIRSFMDSLERHLNDPGES